VESFAIGSGPLGVPLSIVRTGPNGSAQHLYTLRRAPLVWLAPLDDLTAAPLPELQLLEQATLTPWEWLRSLLAADPFAPAFTLDPMRYRAVGARRADGSSSVDYDGDGGDSVRFGDGAFGAIPDAGTSFRVVYRVGGGLLGNVAADAITRIDNGTLLSSLATAVSNPFPASGGADAESAESIRRLAPEAFRAKQFRAVRAEDYQAAAEGLPWVQRAGTAFRHTGSWLTVFTTADPVGAEALSEEQEGQLVDRLNRFRMAGYESYVLSPRFASLDIRVTVCARADAFRGDVETAIAAALASGRSSHGAPAFFDPDRFSFGQALERSALEATIQGARGVDGVREITYRERGVTPGFVKMPAQVPVARNAIIRADNDPSRPDAGSIHIDVQGGK
jgi:predicted phage baseplate assembly protein